MIIKEKDNKKDKQEKIIINKDENINKIQNQGNNKKNNNNLTNQD